MEVMGVTMPIFGSDFMQIRRFFIQFSVTIRSLGAIQMKSPRSRRETVV